MSLQGVKKVVSHDILSLFLSFNVHYCIRALAYSVELALLYSLYRSCLLLLLLYCFVGDGREKVSRNHSPPTRQASTGNFDGVKAFEFAEEVHISNHQKIQRNELYPRPSSERSSDSCNILNECTKGETPNSEKSGTECAKIGP